MKRPELWIEVHGRPMVYWPLEVGMLERITFDANIMGGRACIRGMRIPVSVIVGQIAHGADIEGGRDRFIYPLPNPLPSGEGFSYADTDDAARAG